MKHDCEFESEVLAAVLQSRWPARVDSALRAHVSTCAICSDVAAVARAIDESRDQLRAEATFPSPDACGGSLKFAPAGKPKPPQPVPLPPYK
jgi:hypothetical protein